MTPPPACGCKVKQSWDMMKEVYSIEYCPTHLAAFEMLRLLKDMPALTSYWHKERQRIIKRASGGKNG